MLKKLHILGLTCTALGLTSIQSFSQDIIHRYNGEKIPSKVIEINTNEVKYKDFDNQDGPIYTIEKKFIKQIVYQNGKIEKYDKKHYDSEDAEWYHDNRKNALKFSFFGPFAGYSEISYERNIKVGQSYEISLGAIGLGKNEFLNKFENIRYDQRGVFVSGGYKFSNMPSFIFFGKPRQKHLFHGSYIKPIVYLGTYAENQYDYYNYQVVRDNTIFGSLNIEFGKQWEFANRFVLDIFLGLGYGFDNKKSYDTDDRNRISDYSNNYAFMRSGTSPGLSISLGAKIGYLFDWVKK